MITAPPTAGYASLRQASQYTSLSVSTLRRHIAGGRLAASKVGGRLVVAVAALDVLVKGGAPR